MYPTVRNSPQALVVQEQYGYIIDMRIGNLNTKEGAFLAPMAGVSNRPFRVLAIRAGAAMTFTEMVSSEGIVRHQKKTLRMMEFGPDEQPIGIQLFGANPEVLRKAAKTAAGQYQPDLIDINFGCPVRKVVSRNGGAAALKDIVLMEDIVRATVEGAGGTPVTVKMRTGWDDLSPIYLEVGQVAEKAGAKAVTLHARSRARGFSGEADWSSIKRLKQALSIPVIGNGDVFTPQDARRMLDETGCDAVMVGRAALGDPFIFGRIKHYLQTAKLPDEPTVDERIEMARLHARLMTEQFGEERGTIMMRRCLGWYVKGLRGASQLRPLLFRVSSVRDIDTVFADYLESRRDEWLAGGLSVPDTSGGRSA